MIFKTEQKKCAHIKLELSIS